MVGILRSFLRKDPKQSVHYLDLGQVLYRAFS